MKTLQEMQSLQGRVALITGGAGHLGKMFAEVAAELGAAIVLADRDPAVHDIARDISGRFGTRGEGMQLDLTDRKALAELPAAVNKSMGGLDILVNNAAFTGSSNLPGWAVPFAEQSVESWLAAMDVNLLAPFLLTQKASPFLARSGKGSVVNVASIYGACAPDFRLYEGTRMGNPAAYNASKGGLIQLTRYLATAMPAGVRVNCISPGGIARNQPEPFVERFLERVPLGRMASEEDFKGAAQLLFSDLGSYITGQNLLVDGGWTIW